MEVQLWHSIYESLSFCSLLVLWNTLFKHYLCLHLIIIKTNLISPFLYFIIFQSAKERRSLLLRSGEALEVTVPQISVWTHCDSEGVGGVWTGPGPAETDTGIWSSDPDSSAQVSSPIMGRQHSLDSPPGYQPNQYHRHPYQTVPSMNTPSPPDSSYCQTFSPPMAKPNPSLSLPNATSLVVQSSTSTDKQFSPEELRSFPGEK